MSLLTMRFSFKEIASGVSWNSQSTSQTTSRAPLLLSERGPWAIHQLIHKLMLFHIYSLMEGLEEREVRGRGCSRCARFAT